MKKNKQGSILVYVVILVIITMFLGMVVFNNSQTLNKYKKIENIDTILAESIYYKSKLAIKYDKLQNSNGTGFVDNISCPDDVNMTGNNWREINSPNSLISPTIETKKGAYCSGTYTQTQYSPTCFMPMMPCTKKYSGVVAPFSIDFNNDYTNFSGATYSGETVVVNTALNPYEAQFSDDDNTLMQFTNSPGSDNIDDDFNSDNYNVYSTGTIATGTAYPNDSTGKAFGDDDADARKITYSYIYPEAGLVNVFWNNSKTNKIIDENVNNDDSINMKIGDTSTGILYFDIDEEIDLKIVEFSKTQFDTTGELIAMKTYNYTSTGGEIGYLQNNAGTLSFSDISTANDFIFDFKNEDYAIFMKNNSSGTIFYRIRGYDKTTGKGLYIVPIDDSDPIVIKVLGAGIIKSGIDYIYKFLEIVGEK